MIRHVAVIGAGFSGTLLAINILRHDGPRVTLIERNSGAGRGIAYSTLHADHLLNVRAANMSAFPDDPDHFVRWLAAHGGQGTAGDFAPRATYGAYLRELLETAREAAPERLTLVTGDVISMSRGQGIGIALRDGRAIDADAAVLAVGNLPPDVPFGLDHLTLSPRYVGDPWTQPVAAGLSDTDTVLLLGTGLTMVDVVLMLETHGFRGRMVAMSRRGLSPHPHAAGPRNEAPLAERPERTLSDLVRMVRERAAAIGWRNAVDELRPYTQAMWARADGAARRRFLRHLRPWWDVHRHRVAPPVAARLSALLDNRRLRVEAGKIVAATVTREGIDVSWRGRGAERAERLDVQRIICCTGPQTDITRSRDPLLRDLAANGIIRPDAEHLGIDVDPDGRAIAADGSVEDRLTVIGPMTRGAFWEIVAVPDIRREAWNLARRLSNAHWIGEGL